MQSDQFLHDFVEEMRSIRQVLHAIIDTQLKSPLMDKSLFEKFGQLISRIYGTATTLGFHEIGKYFFAIKEISYMCVHTECELSQMKVLQLMIECAENLENICKCIFDMTHLENIKHIFDSAIKKVDYLAQTDFHHVNRKSVA